MTQRENHPFLTLRLPHGRCLSQFSIRLQLAAFEGCSRLFESVRSSIGRHPPRTTGFSDNRSDYRDIHDGCLGVRIWKRAVFAVRPIADSPLVMKFAERESGGFHLILVLTPGYPEPLGRCRLPLVGRSSACLYPLGFSKVQTIHCSVPKWGVRQSVVPGHHIPTGFRFKCNQRCLSRTTS